jgi:hypothetical protein
LGEVGEDLSRLLEAFLRALRPDIGVIRPRGSA